MKKIILFCVCLCMMVGIFVGNTGAVNISDNEIFKTRYGFNPDIDYAALMIEAAANGNIEVGREYERLRNLKKDYFGIKDSVTFDDLYLLAKIVEVEAGASWMEIEHKRLVASVVLNRIASPEFPNTMREVFYQRGQYQLAGTKYFEKLVPSESSAKEALYVLQYGSIAPKSVVFQAEFRQGSGVYKKFSPAKLGTTYFCYSSYPELYEE